MGLVKMLDDMKLEQDHELKRRKERMAYMVYLFGVSGGLTYLSTGVLFMTSLFAYNVSLSQTTTEVVFWSIWWPLDILAALTKATSLTTIPASWLLLVLNYRLNIIRLVGRIERLNERSVDQEEGTASKVAGVQNIINQVRNLENEAMQINRSSSWTLLVVNVCTTTQACIGLFMGVFTDNALLSAVMSVVAACIIMFSLVMQYVAGDVTS